MAIRNYQLVGKILIFLSFFVMIGINLLADDWGKISDLEKQQGSPEEYPEANAVILFDKGTMEVTTEYIALNRHVRIKVLNKAGVDEVGDIEIYYNKDDKLKNLKAQTITPSGKKHSVDKDDIHRKTIGNDNIETFAFSAVDSGCVLEYRYKKVSERFGSLDPWYFQNDLYTLYSEFRLVLDPGFTYSTATLNMPYASEKAEEEFITDLDRGAPLKRYTWKMNNILPVKAEPYMAFKRNYLATLHSQLVSYETAYAKNVFIKDWTSLGELVYEFVNNYINEQKAIKRIADSLTMGMTDRQSKAEKIYEYVTMEFKTKSDENDRFFTHERLGDLLDLKYGTRDEKNILLIELLKAAEIPAWPVLIGTRNNTVFMPRVFQLHQFNHFIAIAEVNSGVVFLDAWLKYCPFGILPPDSRTTGGLKLDKQKSEIIQVAVSDPPTSRIDHTKIYIDSDFVAVCSTSIQYNGYDATWFGEQLENQKLTELVKDDFLDRLDITHNCDSSAVEHISADQIKLEFYYTLEDYLRKLDTMYLIKPVQFKFIENPFKSEKRFFPVDFSYPFMYQNVCEIILNENSMPLEIPKPVTLQIPGVTYVRNCMFDGVKVIINCQFIVDKPAFPPVQYRDLRQLFIDMAAASEDEIVLTGNSY